jgi:protein-S-isoprenylcysteine O-methyltransferase Ste14
MGGSRAWLYAALLVAAVVLGVFALVSALQGGGASAWLSLVVAVALAALSVFQWRDATRARRDSR